MSVTRLIQRIRETTKELQRARDLNDQELVERLEDELYDLEDELEEAQQNEYDDHHNKEWQ